MHIPSRIATRLLLCCAVASAPAFAFAQEASPAKPAKPAVGTVMSPSATYDKLLSGMEKEFVDAAEAMPEDKFNFAPPTTAVISKACAPSADKSSTSPKPTTTSSAAACQRLT